MSRCQLFMATVNPASRRDPTRTDMPDARKSFGQSQRRNPRWTLLSFAR